MQSGMSAPMVSAPNVSVSSWRNRTPTPTKSRGKRAHTRGMLSKRPVSPFPPPTRAPTHRAPTHRAPTVALRSRTTEKLVPARARNGSHRCHLRLTLPHLPPSTFARWRTVRDRVQASRRVGMAPGGQLLHVGRSSERAFRVDQGNADAELPFPRLPEDYQGNVRDEEHAQAERKLVWNEQGAGQPDVPVCSCAAQLHAAPQGRVAFHEDRNRAILGAAAWGERGRRRFLSDSGRHADSAEWRVQAWAFRQPSHGRVAAVYRGQLPQT
eukprot:5935352-Prymnesium_polylepis.1